MWQVMGRVLFCQNSKPSLGGLMLVLASSPAGSFSVFQYCTLESKYSIDVKKQRINEWTKASVGSDLIP